MAGAITWKVVTRPLIWAGVRRFLPMDLLYARPVHEDVTAYLHQHGMPAEEYASINRLSAAFQSTGPEAVVQAQMLRPLPPSGRPPRKSELPFPSLLRSGNLCPDFPSNRQQQELGHADGSGRGNTFGRA
jgi:hypothetical protein